MQTNGSRKQRVLLVTMNHPKIRPGGAEGYALDLYDAIRDAGEMEPIFLARTGPPINQVARYHAGTPFTTIGDDPNQYLFYNDLSDFDFFYGKSPNRSMATRFFRDFLLEQQPDLIHFQHTLFLGYDFVRVAKNTLPDTPILYMLHEYLPICFRDGQMVRTKNNALCQEESPRRCHECFPQISPQNFFMRKRFIQSHLSHVDLFIAPSGYVRDRYVDWGIPADKIMVEPYARVPVQKPPPAGADRPRNRFAFFGQFTPYKGADVLLKAMDKLGPDFDGHLWIHGANLETQSDAFKAEFADLLHKTKGKVTFAGPYDHDRELGQLMARTDWVIVPSIWWETGPLVVLEAFQHGRPVICSDIGGMSEKVADGVSGLHFRRGDPDSLAEVMRQAVDTPFLWKQLREGIPAVYDIADNAALMTGLYKRMIAARALARSGEHAGGLVLQDA
jgi:glycosyltransferase involved in cell wall biosynthesis